MRPFCATQHGFTTAESLWAAVEKNKSGAVFFFDFARLLRLNRKTRRSPRRLKSRPESRAANHFKEKFFNLYKTLRLRCIPQDQDEDAPGFASIVRQNRRRLRRTGLLRLREESMKEQSAGKMLETWRWMENRQVCVWIDKCYIKQYGTHPTIQDQSQNCTAHCVVEILCRLPSFRGHPTIDVLIGTIGNVAAALVRTKRSFHGIVTDLGMLGNRSPAMPSIRPPLDRVRDPLPNPGWKPLLLSTHQVSLYKGLVEPLDYIASLSNHTHPIVPILLDENIHKRCLKLLYSDRTQRWNWHEKLKRTPVLYGCWHPQKYLVTNVRRRFHSLFVYFRFGRLRVGKTVGSHPKLRVMERTIAGILKCAPHFLRQLRRKANRLQAVADHGGTAIDRLKSGVCKAMLNLLQNWCPLVLYCGFLGRQCNWSGRHPGTAIDAQNFLRLLYVLLIELERAAAEPVVYVTTIAVALLHWQNFNSGLPGMCYGEEFGKVMLSRLGSMEDRHTWAVTPSDVEDLFVQVCAARFNRRLLVFGLSSDIETETRQFLHSYVIDDRLRIRYSPCKSGTSTMERHWEADPDFPSDPYSKPGVDTYRTVLTDVLRTFLRQPRNFSPFVIRLMDSKVLLRSDAQCTNILDTTWAFIDA